MRPKFVALLAVSVLALVGCSAASETAPGPAGGAPASATPSASVEPSPSKEVGEDEEAFIEGLSTVTDKASQLPKNLRSKAEYSYMLKRGKEYCETIAEKGTAEPEQTVNNADDLAIESMILISAQIYLCPAD